jgi:enoyl-CoA hydratase
VEWNVLEEGMSDFTDLVVTREGAVVTIVINRPAQRNAIPFEMWGELELVFNNINSDSSVGMLVLKGAGDYAFSAGADIKDFEKTRSTPKKSEFYRERFERACKALQDLSIPTLAQVHGYCIGAGFELALQADVRFAANNVQMGIPAARMGLAISHEFVSRLSELVGVGNASYLLLSGRLISSEEALRMGLVSNVCTLEELPMEVAQLTSEIMQLSPNSHRLHKEVLRDLHIYGSVSMTPSERLRLPHKSTEGNDFHEAVRAFIEGRRPTFGR